MTPPGASSGAVVALRDGSAAVVRPVTPEDKDALQTGLARMSADSRYRRFLTSKDRLTAAELRYLTEVDHHDHEALVAHDAETREPVGVARYVRSTADPHVAEAAVAVVDAWQGKGLGKALLERLGNRARQEGIRRFSATVSGDNRRAVGLVGSLGPVRFTEAGNGVVEMEIELADQPADVLDR